MEKWGNLKKAEAKFVTGDNIGKTFQYAKTANAQVGFVALSQVYKDGKFTSGSGWVIPADCYKPIRQDSVILNPGKDNKAVADFMKFMLQARRFRRLSIPTATAPSNLDLGLTCLLRKNCFLLS